MAAVVVAIAFAVFVLGVLIKSRMGHRSADQEILLQKSKQP
jgi:multisubunit Na+/H+ antiporter MnhC subunit